MKIDTKDIRQRLSNNTAIDKEEIEALCDEVERSEEAIKALISNIQYLSGRLINDFD